MNKYEYIAAQKWRASKLYCELKEQYGNVMLAGGAPRNWFFDRPARDLDFFIFGQAGEEENTHEYGYMYYTKDVVSVDDDHLPYQKIFVEDYWEMRLAFSNSLSMIRWHPEVGLNADFHFMHTIKEKTVYTNVRNQLDDEYNKRVLSKFPDFKVSHGCSGPVYEIGMSGPLGLDYCLERMSEL